MPNYTIFNSMAKPKDKELSLKELNSVMRHETAGVATRWYELGVELLDSNTAVLDVIKTSHQRDDDRCSEMFKTWLEMKPDASWSQLVASLDNIGVNKAADNVRRSKLSTESSASITTPEQASMEFGLLLLEVLEELKKNESKNLRKLKVMSSTLTVKDNSGVRMFSDSELEGIHACNDTETLLTIKLRHCYRWDDHSMLTFLMSSMNAHNCIRLLDKFKMKVNIKMKLQQIHDHCRKESQNIPEGYHKMIAIVDNKIFSSITKEEYDELKQFVSEHCGVEPYVICPFSKAASFNSIVIEWFIPENVVLYIVQIAKTNVKSFTEKSFKFTYLRISSTVVFDHRSNRSEYDQLLTAVKKEDTIAIEKLINTRYIDVNTVFQDGWTPLHVAAQNGHADIVDLLIKSEANINVTDEDGWTPLYIAVDNGHVDVVNMLIKSKVDVNATKEDGWTPLHVAAENGHGKMVEMLIESEANVDAAEIDGWTSLHVAAASGHTHVAQLLMPKANVNALNESKDTPLYIAAQDGHAQVTEMLIKSGANLYGKSENGWTALHAAAQNGHVHVIKILVKSGISVDATSNDEATPIYVAAQNGFVKAVEMLIKLGANINAHNINDATPLFIAALKGNAGVAELLIKSEANVNAALKTGWTPLRAATKNGYSDVVEMLIKSKADVNCVDKNKVTPLHAATQNGHNQIVKMLVNSGTNVNAAKKDGDTPLHIASRKGNLKVAKTLVKAGADFHTTNELNRMPLQEAVLCGHHHIVQYFTKEMKMDASVIQSDKAAELRIKSLSRELTFLLNRRPVPVAADTDSDKSSDTSNEHLPHTSQSIANDTDEKLTKEEH